MSVDSERATSAANWKLRSLCPTTAGVQQSCNSSRAQRARSLSGGSTGAVIERSLKRDDALSCTGRGHHLQQSGGRDGQPQPLARALRVIRTHYRTLFVGLG